MSGKQDLRVSLLLLCLLITLALDRASLGQADPTAGILPFSVNLGGQYDSINPATGNIMLTIPVMSKAGKIPFSFNLVGNFNIFPAAPNCPGCYIWQVPQPGYYGAWNGGLNGLPTGGLGSKLYFTTSNANCNGSNDEITVSNFTLTDQTGASHAFNNSVTYGPCGNSGGGTGPTGDSSGYTLSVTATDPPQYSLYDRSGNVLTLAPGSFNYMVVSSLTDPDNVAMSVGTQIGSSTVTSTYTDTLGLTALTATVGLSRGSSTPDTYTYTDASGNPQTVTVKYTLYPLRTNFGCSNPQDVNVGSLYFPTSVVLPDGETFTLSYEPTRG